MPGQNTLIFIHLNLNTRVVFNTQNAHKVIYHQLEYSDNGQSQKVLLSGNYRRKSQQSKVSSWRRPKVIHKLTASVAWIIRATETVDLWMTLGRQELPQKYQRSFTTVCRRQSFRSKKYFPFTQIYPF